MPNILRSSLTGLLFVTLWFASPSTQAAFIELTPSPPAAAVGGEVSIDVRVGGLSVGTEIVSTFDLTFAFDPLGLAYLGTDFGTFLGGPLSITDTIASPGQLSVLEVSTFTDAELFASQTSSTFSLATVRFGVLAPGAWSVSVDPALSLVLGAVGTGTLPSELILSDLIGASIEGTPVTAVPEPSTLALLGLGLAWIGLGSGRRRVRIDSARGA